MTGEEMVDKTLLFFLVKIAAIGSIFMINLSDADVARNAISALAFTCVSLLQLLIHRVWKKNNISLALIAIALVAGIMLGMGEFLPLISLLIYEGIDLLVREKSKYILLCTLLGLLYFAAEPELIFVAITVVLVLFAISGNWALGKIDFYRKTVAAQKEEMDDLREKLSDNKRLIKTLKYTASLEERNRLAARIHDKVGHGISGSIIMLEAALLTIKTDPKQAEAAIRKAAVNLREGVDDIRLSLREERPERSVLGLGEIKATLQEFESMYGMQAVFKSSGRLESIGGEIWACISENLNEALTNSLKHSGASTFTLEISVMNKAIKVEYKDNGKSSEVFEKGLGLEAIEERTIKANGRCFFEKTETGFSITNVFTA
jgi:signal transduction histidine kinase